jgi:hypothetical protein
MPSLLTDADVASITQTVASSLDATLPVYRKSTAIDGYGHSTETWTLVGTFNFNVFSASATVLQAYAAIIGTKNALMLRLMQTTDLREGDRVVYSSLNWLVNNIQNAESYTVTKEALITVVT